MNSLSPSLRLSLSTVLPCGVWATSGRQCKDLMFKERKTLMEHISLRTSEMTGTIDGRISGQLYCMRADVARRLYLPRDLSANDDGYEGLTPKGNVYQFRLFSLSAAPHTPPIAENRETIYDKLDADPNNVVLADVILRGRSNPN